MKRSIAMRSPSAFLTLIRWQNVLLSVAGVLLGAWWARGAVTAPMVLITASAAAALTAVANAANDLHDRKLDRVAHPGRPLPSGALAPVHARWTVGVAVAIALIATAVVSLRMLGATVVVAGLMLIYSPVLKARGLAGNVTVAVLASLPFMYGAWAVGEPLAALPLLGVAIPLHFAREIAKDLEDAEADSPTRRTMPVVHGAPSARIAVVGALGVFVVMLWPLVIDRPRLGGLVLPALILGAVAATRAWRGRRGSPSLFKAAMACAMVSLVLAHWPR